MGFIKKQLLSVIEWNEDRDDILFWKWPQSEIKKNSKLVIRPGQDAIFIHNGMIEGIFKDEGNFDIETEIIPFLSTLEGFKFGFDSGFRAEVLFVNTKEHLIKWETANPVILKAEGLPSGMPIRAFGVLTVKVSDYPALIEKFAGIKEEYSVLDVKERIVSELNQLIMGAISKDGYDIFSLQTDARKIGEDIKEELNADLKKIGITCTDFIVESFSYPEEVARMQEKVAAQSMVKDTGKYATVAMANSMGKGGNDGGNLASNMMNMQMGMAMGQQMVNQMKKSEKTEE